MKSGSNNERRERADAIGKQLVARASVRERELDSIVGKDDLFAGVMKRVAEPEHVEVRTLSLRMGVAYASVSLAVAVAATITIFTLVRPANGPASYSSSPSNYSGSTVAASQPDTAVPQPPRPPQDELEVPQRVASVNGGSGDRRMIMADSKTYTQAPRKLSPRPVQPAPSSDDGEFYPISYAGGDSLAGGRIVRVDLPRAQAFAMGIRVPLENDAEFVRADVIVGPDGVPRAARLVR
jgi:hypothetical protein